MLKLDIMRRRAKKTACNSVIIALFHGPVWLGASGAIMTRAHRDQMEHGRPRTNSCRLSLYAGKLISRKLHGEDVTMRSKKVPWNAAHRNDGTSCIVHVLASSACLCDFDFITIKCRILMLLLFVCCFSLCFFIVLFLFFSGSFKSMSYKTRNKRRQERETFNGCLRTKRSLISCEWINKTWNRHTAGNT